MAQWLPVLAMIGRPSKADVPPAMTRRWRRLARGFAAVGTPVRVDRLGTRVRSLDLLRVHCPHDGLERAQQWLGELVSECDRRVAWGPSDSFAPEMHWPTYVVWRGTPCAYTPIESMLLHQRRLAGRPFASWCASGNEDRAIEGHARSAAAIALRLPGTTFAGEDPRPDPHAWVALFDVELGDDARRAEWDETQQRWEQPLHAHGLRTCVLTIASSSPPRALLTVHDGGAPLEIVQERVRAATGRHLPSLPTIAFHRCAADQVEARFDALRAALPDVQCGSERTQEGGLLTVALHEVDRALAALAALP